MLLKLTRGAAATNGLIFVTTEETAAPYFKGHKPNELTELSIYENADAARFVTLVIGQTKFNVPAANLYIEGVVQNVATMAELQSRFSLLFLDSSAGGGGGTTDDTTAWHMVMKNNDGHFCDSNFNYTAKPIGGLFHLNAGDGAVSLEMFENVTANIRKIQLGNVFPVVSPYDYMKLLMDFETGVTKFLQETFIVGDDALDAAIVYANQAQGIIKLGDYPGNTSSVFAEIDTVNEWIRFNTQRSAGANFNAATGETVIGDAFGYGNVCKITVDDQNETITFSASGSRFKFESIPQHANNAAANAGGLTADMLYCTNVAGELILKVAY